jgi:hypothetical protein
MKLTTLILVCAISLSLAIEQPLYKVIQKLGNNMEIRIYVPTKWVTTQVDVRLRDVGFKINDMYSKLYDYISGANSDKQKMDMTAPFLMSYVSKNNRTINEDSEVTASMSFYIPSKFRNNTPKPSANNVVIRELPIFVTAVARISFRWAYLPIFMQTRDDLVKALGSDAKSYDTINMVTANYGSTLISNNYFTNEVWLPKM